MGIGADNSVNNSFLPYTVGRMQCIVLAVMMFLYGTEYFLTADAQAAKDDRMVEIIVDASVSMKGKLKNGESKIETVKKALEDLLRHLDSGATVAVRSFGSQSSREKHDCLDTKLLSPFSLLGAARDRILLQTNGLRPLGFSPITMALAEASKDFPAEFRGDIIIVLISDGRETCPNDPCLLAQNLSKDRTRMVIHTVGLGSDDLSRQQLECVARSTGGKSFTADDTSSLAKALLIASQTPRGLVVRKKGDGMLSIEGAEPSGHVVSSAETGERVGLITQTHPSVRLPAGLYTVSFGKGFWRSVEIDPGVTTLLKPAVLKVEHAGIRGHRVVETDTSEEQGSVSHIKDTILLVPGSYEIMFGKVPWPVTLGQGVRLTLRPGTLTIRNAAPQGHVIKTLKGELIDSISSISPTVPLPPGEYTVEYDGKMKPFTIKEGESIILNKRQ